MKRSILVLALLGGIAFLAGCSMENQKTNSVERTNKAESGEVYTNQEYGFNLIFPDSWQGFTVEKRTVNWGEFGFGDSLDFGFGPQNSLFNIAIHTREQWKRIDAEQIKESAYLSTYLGENGEYVFSFGSAQDVANDAMFQRLREVQDIIKTFQLTSIQKSGKVSAFVSDVSFEYPAEFTYSGGGDIDTGSFSWVNGIDTNGKEFTFMTVFDFALIKCKFEDPALCEIDAWVPANVDDVYTWVVKNYKKDENFTYAGQVKTANTVGEKFISKSVSAENPVHTVVVVKSKTDVLSFLQTDGEKDALFDEAIASIKINQ